jgi:acylphosphatase
MRSTKSGPAARCRCLYSGRVQGVGFRYTARNLALGFDIAGYVKNLPDGRVEIVVEGDPSQVTGFLSALDERMEPFVCKCTQQPEPPTGEFHQFQIDY